MNPVIFVLKKNIFQFEIAILLSVLRSKGIPSELFIEEEEGEDLVEKIKLLNPSMVGTCSEIAYILDLVEGELHANFDILDRVRKVCPETLIFCGGVHSTIMPEILQFNRNIDVIFTGDMETSLVQVAKYFNIGQDYKNTKGIVFRNGESLVSTGPPPFTDFSILPFPDFNSFLRYPGAFRKGYRLPNARGCSYRCSLCFNPKLVDATNATQQPLPRYYPVSYLIESIKHLKEKEKKFKTLYLNYGTFTRNKKFVKEFCEQYSKEDIGIPYVIATRLDNIDNDIARWLKETGCSKVTIAIESGVERLRNEVLKKNLNDDAIYRGMSFLKKHSLRVGVSILFGFPDETIDDAFKTLDMVRKIKADFVGPSVFIPLPGFELTGYAIEKGYLPKDYSIKNFHYTILKEKDYNRFQNMHLLSPLYKYLPCKTLFKLLLNFKTNKFYKWIFHIQRIKAVLKYDLGASPVLHKIRYLIYSHYSIFVNDKEPDIVYFGQKLKYERNQKRGNL